MRHFIVLGCCVFFSACASPTRVATAPARDLGGGSVPPGSNTAPAPSPSKAREVTVGSNPAADIDRDIATIQTLRRAAALYETFVEKAGDEPAYEEAVRRSRERIDDINETITFLEQGIALRAKRDRLESR